MKRSTILIAIAAALAALLLAVSSVRYRTPPPVVEPSPKTKFSLHRSTGVGYFLDFRNREVTADDIPEGPDADSIFSVLLDRCLFDATVAARIGRLRHLEKLSVIRCSCAPADFDAACASPALVYVYLELDERPAAEADAMVKSLGKITGLKEVILSGKNIGDDSLAQLAACRSIESFVIESEQVGSKGVIALNAILSKCDVIRIQCPKVDDAIAPQIGDWKAAREIALDGTSIGDRCVASLITLKKPVELDVAKTNVTRAGFKQLKIAFPNAIDFSEE